MPRIDRSLACNQLNIDRSIQCITQRRRRQYLKKVESTLNMVQGMFHAKFIYEMKYTKWLFNVVIV